MVSHETRSKYLPTIGIECHVQLNTATKLFSGVDNNARDALPNSLISHIDLGMPGALPVLNRGVVERAIKVAYAFNSKPQKLSYFERKHYFYPDLPKGYQITQLQQPVIVGGSVSIKVGGESRSIAINRVQIEEDAGKSTHPVGQDHSLVDLNRAGTPLLEIVSEPDIHSAAEAKAYARELWLLMRYAGVSDADMYHGNMRFDVNVSISQSVDELGTRTETKNLNSFRSVEKAVEYEIDRQIDQLEKGHEIVQETRGWDDAKQKTVSQRSKEEAHDYRYFPEPDLPPIVVTDSEMTKVSQAMPVMPSAWRERLSSLGLEEPQVETLIEAELDDEQINYLDIIETNLNDSEFAKALANWFVNLEIPHRRARGGGLALNDSDGRQELYKATYVLLTDGKLSSTNAKSLIAQVLAEGKPGKSYQQFAEAAGFIQVSDVAEIETIVKQVIADNPKAAEDVRNGENKAIGFLVGQVMKASRGQANPSMAQAIIKEELGI